MFTKAIVRKPSKSMVNGLTTAGLGVPDYKLALVQHEKYIEALKECGLKITILEADENGKVLVAKGFPKTKALIEKAGYKTIVFDMSEYRKIDGGLSCLSLRF